MALVVTRSDEDVDTKLAERLNSSKQSLAKYRKLGRQITRLDQQIKDADKKLANANVGVRPKRQKTMEGMEMLQLVTQKLKWEDDCKHLKLSLIHI